MKRMIEVRCFRSESSGRDGNGSRPDGSFQAFEVPVDGETSIQQVLMYISENLDPTLAFFKHAACRQGFCGRCVVRMNGKPCLACTTPVPVGDEPVTVEPVSRDRAIRDLLCQATGGMSGINLS